LRNFAWRDNSDPEESQGVTTLEDAARSQQNSILEWIRAVAPDYAEDFDRLRGLLSVLDRYFREEWRRHVSTGDAIIDRWERATGLGFGEGSSVYDSALVIGDVHVGRNTWIGPNTVLDGIGGLTIGDWCSISVGVQIYSHDSIEWAVSGGTQPMQRTPTTIGSKTYIGPNTVVGRGVSIGDRCIVGAASLVLADVPGESVAHGVPAIVVDSTEAYLLRRGGSRKMDRGPLG
jgi:acetyltransferase-like isoleucine patch superfamily enzyme